LTHLRRHYRFILPRLNPTLCRPFDEVAHHDNEPRSPGLQSSPTSPRCRLSKTCTGLFSSCLGWAQRETKSDSRGNGL
jgi:hypothetical protein